METRQNQRESRAFHPQKRLDAGTVKATAIQVPTRVHAKPGSIKLTN